MFRLILFALCILSFSTLALSMDTPKDSSAFDVTLFHSAEEDYRFGDFVMAIPKLEKLRSQKMANETVVRYLADSYIAVGRFNDALSLYGEWLSSVHDNKNQTSRFAWLGMSNVLLKLQKRESAIHSLEQWVSYHPDDYVASTMYGGLLVESHRYADANKIWQFIVKEKASTAQDKAAAYYFQALYAYLQGDEAAKKKYAQASLASDDEGAYAALSKKIMVAKPSRPLGLNTSVSLESLYTSNVELLPDFKSPALNKKKSDMVTQINALLLYNFPSFSINYVFSEGFHASRNDLDLAYHSLYAMWMHKQWYISPRYEFAQLGGTPLFQSLGGDIGWNYGVWKGLYALRVKKFNTSYKGSSLAHLGGVSNSLNVSKTWSLRDAQLTTNVSLTDEATLGNARVGKSDAYRQLRLGGRLVYPYKAWNLLVSEHFYVRKYKEALPRTTLPIRKDFYNQWQMKLGWQPEKLSAWQIAVQAGMQNNISNDKTKRFKEWRTGLEARVQW